MTSREPIAIIGTGCRFPGQSDNPSKLWDLLKEPRDLLKEIPEDRFSVDAFYHPHNYHHGTSNVRHSYLLEEDLTRFDAQFFGIKPVEARSIDPQQRLLLETVYESLEAAGIPLTQLRGSDTAVYVGVMSADYTDMTSRDIDMFPTYFATGTARSILSNRLSYFFDWRGPSMTIDTACSSSLVAMHQAVQVLRAGESSVAVVAGSNVILGPEQYIAESKLQMLSPTGRSRMWDEDADGYARGEGVASVVLKRLSQALADGDHVECIIRETGLNQDGRTPGITMPSPSAQTALIQSTYSRAGLDLSRAADRPQYFEAHGTGTPAGDPIEAEAISNAFFGPGSNFTPGSVQDTLYVGSIKTVVGHTEGTAGLAAVIKASLALQAGKVPPNRLLNRLNPKVAPFYNHLKIVSEAKEWPKTADGTRRASVNSFGFGGANAHAILESYDQQSNNVSLYRSDENNASFTPFLFSAASASTLITNLEKYRDYLTTAARSQAGIPFTLRDLSWTLSNRRTTMEYRTVLPAVSKFDDLVSKMNKTIDSLGESPPSSSPQQVTDKPRVLGVFTGQGAQWARMGAELIETSPEASRIIARLDQSLQSLPPQDRPKWTLRDHLLAPPESSQVNTAFISQPLCTAIQVMLVELLKAAGITFSAVVGHSSGEIGAAYAAGYLSGEDAIRIAYYRGLHLRSVSGKKGAMMAVGTSFEDLTELCELPAFEGRVCVAASNSSASVTLSGDADAVDEVKEVLDAEKKFARLLKVDRAYHSHHMQPCAEPYIRSLQTCRIKTKRPTDCRWVSSVFVQDIDEVLDTESLGGNYWVSNLVKPVMFAEALKKTLGSQKDGLSSSPYDLIVEVGPHPALKGPASQTIQDCFESQSIPYTGVLSRGVNSVEAFSTALGSVWEALGDGVVDFATFSSFAAGGKGLEPKLCKGLPTYEWDHNRTHWYESSLSRAFRTDKESPNELLGRRLLDGAPDQLRWRNVLKPREIDWLEGHQVQGQIVFPCAGYVSACLEAAMKLPTLTGKKAVQEQSQHIIKAVEIQDFVVGQAVAFGDDQDSAVEILITMTDIEWREHAGQGNDETIFADFTFYSSATGSETLKMVNNASGRVLIHLGSNDAQDLSASILSDKSEGDHIGVAEVESDRFYDALGKLGFGYTGPFRALTSLKRKLGLANGFIQNTDSSVWSSPLLIHPATLDAAIQSIMLAFCYPGDSMLRSIYLPTGIKRLVINPESCRSFAGDTIDVPFESLANVDTSKSLSGDVSIYTPDGSSKAIQLEGLQTKPLSNPTEYSDLNIFTELVWEVTEPDSDVIVATTPVQELDPDLLFSLERVAYFYLRSLDKQFPVKERARIKLEWHQERLLAYVDHCLSKVARGANPFAKADWITDTKSTITNILSKYPDNIDLRLMSAVGENLPAVIRGETSMLEHMIQDNMLNDFYVVAHGMPRYTAYLASMARLVTHRNPHMNVLEIGAGTGGATKSFLKELGNSFSTYTFTDISSGFFAKAEQVFASYSAKMKFKVLDIEKDIEEQGFADGSFDLIIASLVLHATRNMTDTLKNVRRLLKPGGYLLLLEITENEQMRFGLIFGGLPGWWLGYDDGRALSPCIDLDQWKDVLLETGFSGIHTAIPHHDKLPVPLSIIVSQAVDDRMNFLKEPLSSPSLSLFQPDAPLISKLTLIGGGGAKSAKLAKDIIRILERDARFCKPPTFIKSIEAIRLGEDLPIGGTTLCLADVDEAVFKSMTSEKLRGFQEIFKQSTKVLWITQGARFGDPFSRMVIGFGRTVVLEMLHLRLQFLDIASSNDINGSLATPNATSIAEALLRFEAIEAWGTNEDSQSGNVPLPYSTEPELYLDQASGKLYVPRFKLNKSQNDRYNSSRRTINELVDGKEITVELASQDDGSRCLLQRLPSSPLTTRLNSRLTSSEATVELNTVYSINRAVQVIDGSFLFPIVGENRRTGERVLALSPNQASIVKVPQSFVLRGSTSKEQDQVVESLGTLYIELLAQSVMRSVSSSSQVILLQPDSAFTREISRIAAEKGARLLCLATGKSEATERIKLYSEYRNIHPMATKSDLRHLVSDLLMSSSVDDFIAPILLLNMGDASTALISHSLAELFPPSTVKEISVENLTSSTASLSSASNIESQVRSISNLLDSIKHHIHANSGARRTTDQQLEVIGIKDWVEQQSLRGLNDVPHIIDWDTYSSTLPVQVTPVGTHIKFQADKTYWLVGLTGGLGLSLCEWMAQHGARYLVVSSRSPKVDKRWLQKMQQLGVTVEVMANDVCDRDSVRAVYQKICETLPSIAGVAQGAMVLHDTMFLDLDIARVNKVMHPKVKGSLHLEEIFKETDLDFFIFFSSMAAITGNPGQSAYAGANMFMASLARQRRQRGLNASVVHIGAIFGNGYVTRELTLAQQEFLGKVGNLWLSEHDFRQLFAEAVLAGQAHRGKNNELSTGLKTLDGTEDDDITWFRNPMFQHCIGSGEQDIDGLAGAANSRNRQGVAVKAQLLEAISPAEVYEIISDAFTAKLQSSLQIEEDRALNDLRAEAIGIDSLVAVDIRSWFIKELQVEVPVLKILSGATMGELVSTAQELLPADLTPNLDPNNKEKPADAKKRTKKNEPESQNSKKESTKGQNISIPAAKEPQKRADPVPPTPRDNVHKPNGNGASFNSVALPSSSQQRSSANVSSDGLLLSSVDSPAYSSPNSWSELDTSEVRSQSSTETPVTFVTKGSKETEPGTVSSDPSVKSPAIAKRVPIAFAQSRFWFIEHYLQNASVASNIALSIDLEGSLDVDRFRRAIKHVGQRHEALRTRFVVAKRDNDSSTTNNVMQEVLAESNLELEVRDIIDDTEVDSAYQELKGYKYNFIEGNHMRVLLLRKSPSSFRLIIGYHHINMDGVSLEVILREIQAAYDSKTRLPNVQSIIQYPDFAEKERREYESGQWNSDIAFWKEEFANTIPAAYEPLPLLPMAKSYSRLPLMEYSAHSSEFHLDPNVQQAIQSICSKLNVTPFHFHLSIFYTLLICLVEVEHVCIGISSSNRGYEAGMLQSVGMYLNLLPVLLKSQPHLTFTNILKMVRGKSQSALAHSKVPFDVIVNELRVPRSTTHNPLFQTLVNYRPGIAERRTFCDCESKTREFVQAQTPYDLVLDVIDNPGGDCHVLFAGQSALYDAHHVDTIKDMYKQLLYSFARNPALRLSMASLYDPDDAKRAIELGRGPIYTHTWPQTIPHRIDQMARKYDGKAALVEASAGSKPSRSLTYGQMNSRVNSLATALSRNKSSLAHGTIVGVFMEPGAEWICSLLAVLRLGAIYVPLDPRTGLNRLAAIIEDSQLSTLIVNDSTEKESERFQSIQTRLNVDQVTITTTTKAPNAASPDSVATIMYTSGSTGVPKGIVMKHETFRNNVELMTTKCYFREGRDVMLQQSSYSFDMSLAQIFLALANGGILHIVPKELRGDSVAISNIIATQGITFTIATPSEYISWIRYGQIEDLAGSNWVTSMAGGEPVTKTLTSAFQEVGKADLKLIDCYGPTEITFCSNSRDVDYRSDLADSLQDPNSGSDATGLKTWPNYSVSIVDANMKAVPVGMPGEVLIGGAGVVAGYLHSELDSQGFARNGFASAEFLANGWSRLHRTGDRGRLSRADGSLLLLGRIAGDTQVKLRGLRVDLREVEAAIMNAAEEKIVDVAVTVRESNTTGSEMLVAFATMATSPGEADEHNELVKVLDELPLPPYMRPSLIVHVDKLPSNASNKVDRAALKSLPIPQGHHNLNGYENGVAQDLTDTESRLKKLWEEAISSEVLSQYKITRESDFFHVGGTSMYLIRLREAIEDEFGIQNMSLSQLFDGSTLGGMADLITQRTRDNSTRVGEEKAIDWEEETALPSNIIRNPASKQQFFTQPEVVILTGATGFLGRAILKRLIEDGVVRKIHCLAVRDPKRVEEQFPHLFKTPQVVVHAGDLALPNFGLANEKQLLDIFAEAHVVIHNGTDVSFVKSYSSLKLVNLGATKELVRLSLPHQLSFHYISTAAVTNLTGEQSFEQRSVGIFPPPSSPSELQLKVGGYVATKWASERYLDKVSDRCELPIWIHRPSSITGEGAPETDLMSNMFKYSRANGLVPDTKSWSGWIDMISVESVAMQIADQVYEDYSWPGNVKYLYESGEQEVRISDMKGVLERESSSGLKVKTVSMDEWISRAVEKGLNPLLGEYLRRMDGVPAYFPRLIREGNFF
ncbi:putative hybrid NRPS/PKS enzyme [Daldinia caldariorum]|uniref:putative hybrid NRPS/PKS enzyme n=1 Tax=Daldinia caldariorum TaxID=326644 RepID=UPI0020078421|nr:putative hybrid NRPS/PKS enzyme [Daldinia caldariorum]KAI1463640.1 putative hybrid NRPS/PKS enzyme [Daldinia caldariorum]